MVECRSGGIKLNKPFSGPVSTLMSSSAESYSFSLSGRSSAVGLNALTRFSGFFTVSACPVAYAPFTRSSTVILTYELCN